MSFPAYPTYKSSGCDRLGPVPDHWQVLPCRALVDECVEKNSFGRITEYLSLMANVGIIRYEDKGDVGNKKPDDLSKCKIVKRGDLVINSMNYGIGSYGLSPLDGICSPVYIVLDTKDDVIVERFVLRIFEEKEFQAFAQSFGNGILAHRSAIGWDDLKNVLVALPPIAEQILLASFLDHETARIDALIEEQQRLIELLKEKRQAVISQAVTKGLDPTVPMKDSGVEWLGEVPAHWGVVSISRIFEIRAGGDLKTEFYSDVQTESHKHPIFTNATNESAIYGYTSKAIFPGGTITVTGRGDVGYAIFRSQPYDAIIRLLVLKPVRDVQAKLYAYMVNAVLTFSVGSSAISQLSAEQIAPYKVLLPPIGEQTEILALLDQATMEIDALVNEAHGVISLLQERRSALISAAVTGKIDVRSWQPPASAPTPELAQEAV